MKIWLVAQRLSYVATVVHALGLTLAIAPGLPCVPAPQKNTQECRVCLRRVSSLIDNTYPQYRCVENSCLMSLAPAQTCTIASCPAAIADLKGVYQTQSFTRSMGAGFSSQAHLLMNHLHCTSSQMYPYVNSSSCSIAFRHAYSIKPCLQFWIQEGNCSGHTPLVLDFDFSHLLSLRAAYQVRLELGLGLAESMYPVYA